MVQDVPDHPGEVFMFKLVDFMGDGFRRVIRRDRGHCLKDMGAMVIFFIYLVDGDARLGIAGSFDGLVHVHTVHAFTAIFRQQGRVDIDDLVRESGYEGRGDLP